MRVVIDANIFVSFLLTGGETISSLVDFWEERKFTLLSSKEILAEIRETTRQFFKKGLIEEKEVGELLWRLENDAEEVVVHSCVSVSPDKKDNRYLACALDGEADYLITGDKKHLLALEKIGKTKIISPKEFKNILV